MNASENKICYLCGKIIDYKTDEIDQDHVPPKQFYPESFRKERNPNLFSLEVHKICNKSYQKDEDYFFNSIGPLSLGSNSGGFVISDLKKRFERHKGSRILGKMGHSERKGNGLYKNIPGNKEQNIFKNAVNYFK